MRPAYCDKHGPQPFTQTSPKLAEKISAISSVSEVDIRRIEIDSGGKSFQYLVDVEFLKRFMLPVDQDIVVLRNCNKGLKQLNDRLIIQKITKEMKWVCPLCFNNNVLQLNTR